MMNDRAYVKLFSGIVTSSIWNEPLAARVVWITMLASKNQHGEVHATLAALARLANVSIEEAGLAIKMFLAPDPDSRTPDNEGRRIEVIPGGWRILNSELYKRMASDAERKEYQARKYVERKDSTSVNNRQQPSTDSSHAESESDAKTETRDQRLETRDRLTDSVNHSVKPPNLSTNHPTLEDCISVNSTIGLQRAELEKCFHHYNAQGWKTGAGVPLKSLSSVIAKWKGNASNFTNKNAPPEIKTGPATEAELQERFRVARKAALS
jgi:hypothetical protein